MFTGIIEEVGTLADLAFAPDGESARLTVSAAHVVGDAHPGDSIAVAGVCLTVTEFSESEFAVDVMKESLDRSGLRNLAVGDAVNLERAVPVDGRLGGHIVQGHVDGRGELIDRIHAPKWDTVRFTLPAGLRRYVVEKGSIAVDGVSLTVAAVSDDEFSVGLIPATLQHTTLGRLQPGHTVNLEVDVLAKYVENLVAGAASPPSGTATSDPTFAPSNKSEAHS